MPSRSVSVTQGSGIANGALCVQAGIVSTLLAQLSSAAGSPLQAYLPMTPLLRLQSPPLQAPIAMLLRLSSQFESLQALWLIAPALRSQDAALQDASPIDAAVPLALQPLSSLQLLAPIEPVFRLQSLPLFQELSSIDAPGPLSVQEPALQESKPIMPSLPVQSLATSQESSPMLLSSSAVAPPMPKAPAASKVANARKTAGKSFPPADALVRIP
jgi:hypothetical protein